MSVLSIRLFGKFSISRDEQTIDDIVVGKPRELLCYLLVCHERPIAREFLAGLLWGDCTTEHSRKYLRKALWQLQRSFHTTLGPSGPRIVRANSECVFSDEQPELLVDVAQFEKAVTIAQDSSRRMRGEECIEALRSAVDLYRGDLLEGWYQDWCLCERERLQNQYLGILDKLILYSETHRDYENGKEYCMRVLQSDRAHENTHRHLMRLYYLTGDRERALRQYRRCTVALKEELGVGPSSATENLYHEICAEHFFSARSVADGSTKHSNDLSTLQGTFDRLEELTTTVARLHSLIEETMEGLRHLLKDSHETATPGQNTR